MSNGTLSAVATGIEVGDEDYAFAANERITFYEDGEVKQGTLSVEATGIEVGDEDYAFAANKTIIFHATGVVIYGNLASVITVDSVLYTAGKWVWFYDHDGSIAGSDTYDRIFDDGEVWTGQAWE